MKLADATTCDEMRKAIRAYAQHDPLSYNVFKNTYFQGLSGEDTYVILAYHALREKAYLHENLLEVVRLMPPPPMVIAR